MYVGRASLSKIKAEAGGQPKCSSTVWFCVCVRLPVYVIMPVCGCVSESVSVLIFRVLALRVVLEIQQGRK